MGDVDPEVARSFGFDLRNATEALKRWEKKCAEVRRQHRKLHPPMVSDAGSNFKRTKWDAPISDSPRNLPVAGIRPKEQEQFANIDEQKKKCDEVIEKLKKLIEGLNKSRTSGTVSVPHLSVAVREKPSFISKIVAKVSRGEMLHVLETKGQWMRVRTANDIEGWVHKSDTRQRLPIELTSEPGGAGKKLSAEQEEEAAQEQSGGRG